MLNKNTLRAIAISFGVLTLFATSSILNVKAEDKISNILYIKDGCEYCEQLETVITQNSLDTKLTITRKNIADEAILSEFKDISTNCGIESPGTPLLYSDSKCFFGFTAARDELLRQIGIESNSTEETTSSDDSSVKTVPTPSPTPTPTPSVTTQKTNNIELEWYQSLLIIVAPIAFVVLGYLIVTRLKV
jgi:hypothetical protein